MELQLPSLPLFLAFCLLLVLVLKKGLKSKSRSTEPHLPPGPWELPIIGSMHHLIGRGATHHVLRDLARKHGPLMFMRLGQVDVVVASSREATEEILKTQDLNFASRPELAYTKIVTYGSTDVAFAPYGDHWRQLRKLCVVELLSTKRVKSFSSLREEEAFYVMEHISMAAARTTLINLREELMRMTNNVVSRAAFGKKCEQQQRFLSLVTDAVETVTGFSVADLFPSLKYLDLLSGLRSRLERIHHEMDEILDEIIKQHQLDESSESKEEDLVDVLLRVKEHGDLELPITMDNIKAVILDVFLGGTETSASVVEWAMSELMRNPEAMERAQKEVREALKGKTRVEENDVEGLNYLKSVIKETLRLHPPGPLLIPRLCRETCQILGYKIPAGSRVIINCWALGRDPQYWDEPESFKPERFHDSLVDFKGANFEFVPFGAGRRVCPGMTFGLATVETTLAKLLFHFDWELPSGMKPKDLDMSETPGANAARLSNLCLLPTPRVPLPRV